MDHEDLKGLQSLRTSWTAHMTQCHIPESLNSQWQAARSSHLTYTLVVCNVFNKYLSNTVTIKQTMKCPYIYLLSKYLVILEAEGQGKQWPHTDQQLIIHRFVAGGGSDAAECLWGSLTLKLSSYCDVCPQSMQFGEALAIDCRLQSYISCVLQLEG